MIRSKLSRFHIIVFTIALAQSLFFLLPTVARAEFDPNYIISDSNFTNYQSMGADRDQATIQIQEFLTARGSYLATYVIPPAFTDPFNFYNGTMIGPIGGEVDSTGWTAAKVISYTSFWYKINPQVTMATLFKEQSWGTSTDGNTSTTETARRLRWAMGFAVTESGVIAACDTDTNNNPTGSCAGFAMQVDWGAGMLSAAQENAIDHTGNSYGCDFDDSGQSEYQSHYWTNTPIVLCDGTNLNLKTGAAGALYRYTPHNTYGGNFRAYFINYFGNIDYVDPGMAVYRFWNENGTHFYTASEAEKTNVIARWPNIYRLEGVAYRLDTANPLNTTPLYRFYNKSNNTHFYTASEAEKNNIIARWSNIYQLDGVAYNVSTTGGTPVYRFWNNNGTHFYTASEAEKNNIIASWPNTYKLEGVAYYIN